MLISTDGRLTCCLKVIIFAISAVLLVSAPALGRDPWYGDPPVLSGAQKDFSWRWKPTKKPQIYFRRIGSDGPVSLEDWSGKIILLNVWATWCPPCVAEMPALDALQARHGGKDFEVVALSVDNLGPDVVTAFLVKHRLNNLTPYIGRGRETFDGLNMKELPTTFLLGRDGRVWGTMAGPAAWDSPQALDLIDHAIGLNPPE